MNFNHPQLRKAIQQADQKTLANLLLEGLERLDTNNQFELLAGFFWQEVTRRWSDEVLLEAVRDFHERSVKGEFYDNNWEWSSKTYDTITPLTRSWYDEAGFWLDVLCAEEPARSPKCRMEGFIMLIGLIDNLTKGTIIIPHNTVGEEHIYTKRDYHMIYQNLKNLV